LQRRDLFPPQDQRAFDIPDANAYAPARRVDSENLNRVHNLSLSHDWSSDRLARFQDFDQRPLLARDINDASKMHDEGSGGGGELWTRSCVGWHQSERVLFGDDQV